VDCPDQSGRRPHIYKFGDQPVSLGIGGRVYAETPDQGPDWGIRAVATFLFPKKG
jgi:hypothetical protein